MDIVVCQKCGAIFKGKGRNCLTCGAIVSQYSTTSIPLIDQPPAPMTPAVVPDPRLLERMVHERQIMSSTAATLQETKTEEEPKVEEIKFPAAVAAAVSESETPERTKDRESDLAPHLVHREAPAPALAQVGGPPAQTQIQTPSPLTGPLAAFANAVNAYNAGKAKQQEGRSSSDCGATELVTSSLKHVFARQSVEGEIIGGETSTEALPSDETTEDKKWSGPQDFFEGIRQIAHGAEKKSRAPEGREKSQPKARESVSAKEVPPPPLSPEPAQAAVSPAKEEAEEKGSHNQVFDFFAPAEETRKERSTKKSSSSRNEEEHKQTAAHSHHLNHGEKKRSDSTNEFLSSFMKPKKVEIDHDDLDDDEEEKAVEVVPPPKRRSFSGEAPQSLKHDADEGDDDEDDDETPARPKNNITAFFEGRCHLFGISINRKTKFILLGILGFFGLVMLQTLLTLVFNFGGGGMGVASLFRADGDLPPLAGPWTLRTTMTNPPGGTTEGVMKLDQRGVQISGSGTDQYGAFEITGGEIKDGSHLIFQKAYIVNENGQLKRTKPYIDFYGTFSIKKGQPPYVSGVWKAIKTEGAFIQRHDVTLNGEWEAAQVNGDVSAHALNAPGSQGSPARPIIFLLLLATVGGVVYVVNKFHFRRKQTPKASPDEDDDEDDDSDSKMQSAPANSSQAAGAPEPSEKGKQSED